MTFNTIIWRNDVTRFNEMTIVGASIISWQFADSNSLPVAAYISLFASILLFFFYMDNGFKIGAETRIHGNVTIVNEKSSWIPNFSDYLFVKTIFMKKFYCKDYTHHDVMLFFSSIL